MEFVGDVRGCQKMLSKTDALIDSYIVIRRKLGCKSRRQWELNYIEAPEAPGKNIQG